MLEARCQRLCVDAVQQQSGPRRTGNGRWREEGGAAGIYKYDGGCRGDGKKQQQRMGGWMGWADLVTLEAAQLTAAKPRLEMSPRVLHWRLDQLSLPGSDPTHRAMDCVEGTKSPRQDPARWIAASHAAVSAHLETWACATDVARAWHSMFGGARATSGGREGGRWGSRSMDQGESLDSGRRSKTERSVVLWCALPIRCLRQRGARAMYELARDTVRVPSLSVFSRQYCIHNFGLDHKNKRSQVSPSCSVQPLPIFRLFSVRLCCRCILPLPKERRIHDQGLRPDHRPAAKPMMDFGFASRSSTNSGLTLLEYH